LDIVGVADFTNKNVSEIRLPARPGIEEISTEEDRKFYQVAESSFTTSILPAEGPRRMRLRATMFGGQIGLGKAFPAQTFGRTKWNISMRRFQTCLRTQ